MNAYIEKNADKNYIRLLCRYFLKNTYIKITKKLNPEYILTVARLAPDKMYIKYLVKDFAYLHEKNLIKRTFLYL